ncbi:MAG: hypothetical protein HXY28_12000 [Hydrogenophilaceae bacterium]|jgi:hypothetical protein|nr:hypothetical protein [Hydrogenophilaceae bacterium]
MSFANRIGFDPALSAEMLLALAALAGVCLAVYAWRRGGAPIARAAGIALILLGLAQPMWVRETRQPASDIALVIIDQSESMALAGRAEAAQRTGQRAAQELTALGFDVRVREARGGPDGSRIIGALEEAYADVDRDRRAGAVVITDGQIADAEAIEGLEDTGPAHAVIVGDPSRGDRRLELLAAPAFGIVGEPFTIEARVEDPNPNAIAPVTISIDGRLVYRVNAQANRVFRVELETPKRGANMVIVEAARGPQEIALANNRAAFTLAGVRDRLRVLLITGEPHAGARVWRNLLKSDPAVDLVHFTILRPPEKTDFTPLDELALIPFPTRELFQEQLRGFDLIIFDRYRQRRPDILEPVYFHNIAERVEDGGALLISAGPWDADPSQSLYSTPLGAILPARPTGSVSTRAYRPEPTALGLRHPVVRGLPQPQSWGPWTRLIDAEAPGGQTVLSGHGRPLLVLDRAGRGRVAQLFSDQAWLWARGYQGGGPHGELLRRLAHWLMQEPELEDERLSLRFGAGGLTVERASLSAQPGAVTLIAPSGAAAQVALAEAGPGVWRATTPAEEQGLYEARAGALRAYAAIGPLNPREAARLNATGDLIRTLTEATRGGLYMAGEDARAAPQARAVERGGRAHGDDWMGFRRNGAYVVRAAAAEPLGPGWAWAAAGVILLMFGWRREAQ